MLANISQERHGVPIGNSEVYVPLLLCPEELGSLNSDQRKTLCLRYQPQVPVIAG
jgi:hypothetical protein